MRKLSGSASTASFTSASVKRSISSSSARAAGPGRLEAAEPAVEVEVLDLVEVGLVGPALLGPVRVDVGVREDPVEPGLEVRALLEAAEAAVGLEVGLLHEVLGVGRVARHAQGAGVQRAHVLHREVGELRLVGHGAEPTVRSPP